MVTNSCWDIFCENEQLRETKKEAEEISQLKQMSEKDN